MSRFVLFHSAWKGNWHHSKTRKQKAQGFGVSAALAHLSRYVDEFTFRLNEGNVKRHTLQRLDSFVDATKGRGITYKELTQ